MLESVLQNLINIGWAMLIFLAAYLANVAFSLWYNIKILHESFDKDKLIACKMSIEEIGKQIGVDSLGYLSIEDVVKLADNTQCGFCTACFGGGYPTAVPQDGGKDRFECKISERERT